MEFVLFGGFVWWLYLLCRRSDAIEAGKMALAEYSQRWWSIALHQPERLPELIENHLVEREAQLDQEIQSFEDYLKTNPSPPKGPLQ